MQMSFGVGMGRINDIRDVARLARTAEDCGYARISFPDTPAFNRVLSYMDPSPFATVDRDGLCHKYRETRNKLWLDGIQAHIAADQVAKACPRK